MKISNTQRYMEYYKYENKPISLLISYMIIDGYHFRKKSVGNGNFKQKKLKK